MQEEVRIVDKLESTDSKLLTTQTENEREKKEKKKKVRETSI